MQHFANFGIVKQANKQLKNRAINSLYRADPRNGLSESGVSDRKGIVKKANQAVKEAKQNPKEVAGYAKAREFLDERLNPVINGAHPQAYPKGLSHDPLKYNMMSEGQVVMGRGDNRTEMRENNPVLRKPKSGEYYPKTRDREVVPDTNGFSDIRKTDDHAASPTGYLGFRTDPYKGYGGMMEEPVDVIPTGKRAPKARMPY